MEDEEHEHEGAPDADGPKEQTPMRLWPGQSGRVTPAPTLFGRGHGAREHHLTKYRSQKRREASAPRTPPTQHQGRPPRGTERGASRRQPPAPGAELAPPAEANLINYLWPLLIVLLVYLGMVSVAKLRSWWRHALVVIFIISAIVTPTPDPVTQTMLAVPLYALYWLAILVASRVEKRKA